MEFLKNLFLSRWFMHITFENKSGQQVEGWRVIRAIIVISALNMVADEIEKQGGTNLMFVRFNKL